MTIYCQVERATRAAPLKLDVDQFRGVIALVAVGRCRTVLRGAPVVNVGDLVDAGDGAVGRTSSR